MDSIKNGFSTWAPQRSKNTDEVTKRISESAEGLPAEILDYQKQKATEILSCCIQPGAIRDSKRVGLVVGKVQSGKTTSFTYLSSLAADNGYKIIVHLLGTTKNLVKDNANSVQEILSTNNSSNHWYAKEFDGDSFVSDFPHTTMEQKLYPRETGLDFLGNNRPETVVYIYLIKNHNMIDRLASYLSDFHENLEEGHSPLPILIIDDEVDSFSQDVGDDDPSSTHESLQNLFSVCSIATYVGYTATAAAIANADPANELNPDFLCTLDPGKDYDGNKELFGQKLHRLFPDEPNPQYIQTIPEYSSKDENGVITEDIESRNQSLKIAFCYWLVGSILAASRDKLCGGNSESEPNCSTFMIHPGTTQDSHSEMARVITAIKEDILDSLEEDDEQNLTTYAENLFKDIYDEMIDPSIDSILFTSLVENIKAVMSSPSAIGIRILNSDTREGRDSIPNIDYKDHHFWIVIGGTGLSRGYVVRGLLTTWMPRLADTITADTLEQTGRFFGYHKGYKDLIRIFLRFGAIEAFKAYQFYESSLLAAVDACIQDGVRLYDSTYNLYIPPEFQHDTSPLKSKGDFALSRFVWAQSEYCSFLPISEEQNEIPQKNMDFYNSLNNCLLSLDEHGLLMPVNENQYSGWYDDSSKLQSSPDTVFKAASDLSLEKISELLIDPLTNIRNLDNNLRIQLQSLKETDQKCDLILIKHPGPGGGHSFRTVIREVANDQGEHDVFRVGGIHQGGQAARSPAGFKGDANVIISENNFTIHITSFDSAHYEGEVIDTFGNFFAISISRPGNEMVSIKTLN